MIRDVIHSCLPNTNIQPSVAPIHVTKFMDIINRPNCNLKPSFSLRIKNLHSETSYQIKIRAMCNVKIINHCINVSITNFWILFAYFQFSLFSCTLTLNALFYAVTGHSNICACLKTANWRCRSDCWSVGKHCKVSTSNTLLRQNSGHIVYYR